VIGLMHVRRCECSGLNKTVFVHINVCLTTIGGFTLTIRALFDVVISFWILNAVASLLTRSPHPARSTPYVQ
jgi:hypothetical protein